MACDEIINQCSADRGSYSTLTFARCSRGFTLNAQTDYNRSQHTFAFDKIEDVAAWLVEQYGPPPKPPVATRKKPTTRSRRRR
jgi:hypothetical protein